MTIWTREGRGGEGKGSVTGNTEASWEKFEVR